MLVFIKNAPGTPEAKRGVRIARELAADIVFMQDAVYYARKNALEGFCGMGYAVKDDLELRGVRPDELEKEVKVLDYGELIDLLEKEVKVMGIF